MKTYKKMLFGAAVTLAMASCSKEAPFNNDWEEGTGRLMKSAIEIDLRADEQITRADEGVDMDNFVISIFEDGATEPYVTYTYGEMPEVVTLPAGVYKATATLGSDEEAEFDNPYYLGQTESFRIEADKVTDNIGDLVCRLSNVKVSVYFDYNLTLAMSSDTKVNVKMNDGKILSFTKEDELSGRSGYYRFEDGMKMTANFLGTVEGWVTNETKVYSTINNGTHYKITFRLHTADDVQGGDSDASIKVDGSLEAVDVERNVVVEDEPLLDDDERPGHGQDPNPPTPPQGDGPVITPEGGITLDGVNVMKNDGTDVVKLTITSETGITGFTVDIKSPNLTADELSSVGLSDHLDLVNPGSLRGALEGLELPVDVGGMKDVSFNISKFIPMLGLFGAGQHDFVLKVTDASGATEKTLTLKFN